MPMMLKPNTKEWDQWLSPEETIVSSGELEKVLAPKNIPNNLMWYEVSKDVNYVRNDKYQLIEPVVKSSKKQDILDMIKSKTETDDVSFSQKDTNPSTGLVRESKRHLNENNEEDRKWKIEKTNNETARNGTFSEAEYSSNGSIGSRKRTSSTTENFSHPIDTKINKSVKSEDDNDVIVTQVSPLKGKSKMLSTLLNGKQTHTNKKHAKRRRTNK